MAPKQESPMKPRVDTLVKDTRSGFSYKIEKVLGKGGFATVYLSTRLSDNISVALKEIVKKDSNTQKKIETEVFLHRRVKSPAVVELLSFFETTKHFYLVLELCDRKTLSDVLRENSHLAETMVNDYFRQLVEAVQVVHRQQIIHRDLKLSNLLLKEEKLKLCDFGLATLCRGEEDRKAGVCGTPNYIAPEVIFPTKQGYSYEADIWSLGILLYTFFVGKPPFHHRDVKKIYQKIKKGSFSFPRNIQIPKEAKELIKILLSPLPSDRPSLEEIMEHPFMKPVKLEQRSKGSSHTFHTIRDNLSGILSANPLTKQTRSKGPAAKFQTYVTGWFDRSHKYGLGYSLSTGDVGVSFNDKTALLFSPTKLSVEYMTPKTGFRQVWKYSLEENHSSLGLTKKIQIARHFYSHFQRKGLLEQPLSFSSEFVVKSVFTKRALFLRLISNIIQAFFFDGTMLLVSSNGLDLLWVDKKRKKKQFRTEALRHQRDRAIIERLHYIKEFLSSCLTE